MLPVMNLPRLSELPNWCDFKRVALDTETRDDKLKELGPGVRRGGYITGISFCCGDENGPAFYLPIRHEGGGNYDDPARVFEYLRDMVKHYRGEIIGANLPYDLDYLAEQNLEFSKIKDQLFSNLRVHNEPYSAMENSHAVVVLTEWDEFKSYNWEKVYNNMLF